MSTTLDRLVAPPREASLSLSIGRALPWLTAAMVLAVGVSIVDALPVGVVHDDGMYVVLAKALATGHGYHWLHVPGAPPATHFPPGYPAVLALLWLAFPSFPQNVLLFKLANACFAALAAAGWVQFARDRFGMSPLGAASLAIISILGIPMLTLSVMVMSEPLFLALLIPTLLYAERLVGASDVRRRDVILLGLAAGLATLVRTHGIALIAAVPIILLARRRRISEAAIFAVVAVAVVLPWQLWARAHAGVVPAPMRGNYESYGAWLSAGIHTDGVALLWRTAQRTSIELTAMFATLAAPSLPALFRYVALGVLTVLSIFGVRAFTRQAPVSALFLALYAAIVIVWPFTPARFVWGVWPLVLLVPVLGAREVLRWRPAIGPLRVLRVGALLLTFALATGHAAYTVRGYRGRWWASIPRAGAANLRPLVLWAAQRTAPTDVLAVEAESAVYLYTGRRTVPVHTFTVQQYFQPRTPEQDATVIVSLLASYHVDAVAVTTSTMRAAVGMLASRTPPVLALSDSFPGGIVFTPTHR
jgi:hypothetical protein